LGEDLLDQFEVCVSAGRGSGVLNTDDHHAGECPDGTGESVEVSGVTDRDENVVQGPAGLTLENVDLGDVTARGADGGGDPPERAGAVRHADPQAYEHNCLLGSRTSPGAARRAVTRATIRVTSMPYMWSRLLRPRVDLPVDLPVELSDVSRCGVAPPVLSAGVSTVGLQISSGSAVVDGDRSDQGGPVEVMVMSGCRRCEDDVLHCHGTLVRHGDGGWECSAEGCTGDAVGHDFVLVCADLWSGCCPRQGWVAGAA
jgi:hypothetical protein